MAKKTNLMILIVVILFLIIGFIGYTHFFNQNDQIEISNVVFTIPEGYHQTNSSDNNQINMTNGYNTMILSKSNVTGIKKNIYDYQKYKNNKNYSTELSNFTVNNITVFKVVVVNDTGTVHYWFNYDNKTYTVFSWDANKNSDDFVSELLNSIKSK